MNNKLLSIIAVFFGLILPIKMQAQGTVGDAISAPRFNFEGDNLVMTCDTEGADIYYVMSEFADEEEAYSLSENLDVSEANSMRTLYTQPIPITKNVVIKAVAKMPQIQGDSEVTTLIYSYTAWSQLLEAMEYGFSVQARAQDNPQVSDDLKEHLNWALEEGQMIYEIRGEMYDSYEAEHFAQEILEIAHEIEEIIGPAQTGPEPYAVLSNNNTVLTFYYNESKGAFQGSMYVGPFGSNGRRGWDDFSNTITTVVFDESFANCTTLTSTAYWFYGCERLTTITGINNLKTDNVTSMEAMFYGCLELPILDLSGFNTSKVTNIDWMFLECSKLTTIYVSDGWSTANIPEVGNVFSGCYALVGGAGTTYSEDKYDSSYAHIDGGINNPGYFTDINAPVISEVMLTGKIDNYWYDETGNDPNGYEAIIFTLPRTPENGNIWEINVLNTFVRNQLAFTTPDGEAVDNITGEFLFESNENMVALDDGRILMYENENEEGEIAMVESGMGMIRIINSEITQRLLNDPNSKYMALPVSVVANLNGREVPVINGSFTVLVQLEKPQEPEPYAVLSQNNTVLTFYYDTNKSNRGGFDINNYYIENDSNSPYSTITTAVFDASFAEYKPTSTAYWFQKCSSLTSIIGLENLKTDNVWNMHDMFSHCSSLTSLDLSGFKTDNLTDMTQMFDGCSGLKSLNVSGFKTDKVTTMWAVFRGCSSLTSLDVSGFKTDNVTLMTQMFYNCSSLTSLDVSGFKTDKVTRMEDLFYGCSGVTKLDVSGFKTNNATSIYGMFEHCSSLTSLDVSGFRTDKVTRIHNLFYGCSSLKTIYGSDWSTVSLEDGEGNNMFTGCNALVGGAGTHYNSSHTNYTYAHIDGGTANPGYFTDKNAPTSREVFVLPGENGMITGSVVTPDGKTERFEIVGGKEAIFNVPNGSSVNLTFRPNAGYRLADVILNGNSVRSQMPTDSTYVIQNILENMELVATFAALPVEPYAVLSNNNTVLTFYYDEHKEERNGMSVGPFEWIPDPEDNISGGAIPHSEWYEYRENITNVVFDPSFANCSTITSTMGWFYRCHRLTSITGISNLKTDNVINMGSMFFDCTNLTNLDVSGFNTGNVIDMSAMFMGCSSLTNLDVSGFNTENVASMGSMFGSCNNLTSLDVSRFNTSKVEHMSNMFYLCSSLEDIDLGNFNTTSVRDMGNMFVGCSSLTSLDLSSFNTEKVTSMINMFLWCSNLLNLNISNFNTSNVTDNLAEIFSGCSSLASIQAGSANIPAEEYARIANPNLLVYVNEPSLAPEGIQNVVINGVAQEIILTDVTEGNNNWNCPEEFRAEKITYTRNFKQQTEIGISRGWESIALPFTVQTITHEAQGQIIPFGAQGTGKYFWLRGYSPEGLHRATVLEANTPYVISMPNNPTVYPYEYNLNGRVTFSAENTIVPATPDFEEMIITRGNITMAPIFVLVPRDEAVYAINVGQPLDRYAEGSVFTRELREVRPFEAATTHEPINGARPKNIRIAAQPNYDITGIKTIEIDEAEGTWYSLDGRQMQGQPQRKGVYLQKGKKVVIK